MDERQKQLEQIVDALHLANNLMAGLQITPRHSTVYDDLEHMAIRLAECKIHTEK
jgi:hypothetical protein